MTDRERLIELIQTILDGVPWGEITMYTAQDIADHLLANGVIVPPCKVLDKIYIITNISQEIVESVVIGIWMADGVFSLLTIHGTVIADNIGKTVFLTKEEAEKALKEREQNDL
jgi:hypothetical protein